MPVGATGELREGRHDQEYVVVVHTSASPTRVELRWAGGLVVEPPTVVLEPGQPSEGIRIIDYRFADDTWLLAVEGMAGRTYTLRLHGEEFSQVEGAASVGHDGSVTTISVTIPGGNQRGSQEIRISR